VPDIDHVVRVRAATILHRLQVPVVFGSWVMRHREFCLVRVDSASGRSGFAYALTRDGPVAAIVDRTIAPQYIGQDVDDPEASFFRALWANNSVHAAGIGMRALSIVDIAAWDLAAKSRGQSITAYLGGERRRMPVAAVVGYPPSISAEETVAQVGALWDQGWRRFKLPIALTRDGSIARLRAAREAYPDAWLGIDANFLHKTAADAIEFGRRLDGLGIGWFEDIVPPGDALMVRQVREAISTPVAMGDEQGGSYHPQALLKFDAVDFNRLDATTNGGVTRLRGILREVQEHGNGITTHMYPHVHSQLVGALGYTDVPIEWGVPGTGVHPMDDPLVQPVVRDGLMDPLPDLPGFGVLVDPAWIAAQEQVIDPDGLLHDL
jgi:L-alanine-DL-glutamate epimerase-like enolase superfamily enzyme